MKVKVTVPPALVSEPDPQEVKAAAASTARAEASVRWEVFNIPLQGY
ncbi:hypothetical protein SMD20_46105 [Nonomuraea sp. LP-02]|nr:hypothetical protein [Nonomuraea sp. LP-02]MED7931663.1 hypothetical protein [Nonomuraea sp. LP-02]